MLEKLLRWIALAGIFLLPFICLIQSTSLVFADSAAKNFAFRIIVEVIAGAWIALAIVYPSYRPRRSWVLGALGIFVFVILIADIFGAYPFLSLWSNYERMEGWVSLAHLLAYTLAAGSMLTAAKHWRYLFWTSLAVSVCVAVYGFLQLAGKVPRADGTIIFAGRIDAALGNPIYLAVYLLFHIFIAAMLWTQQWAEKGTGRGLGISLVYGSVIVLDTLALLFTGARGTLLGLICGALLTAILMICLARNSRNVRRASVAAVVGIVALAGGFILVRDQAWVQKIGFLKRLATIFAAEGTGELRIVNWSIAWQGVKERPILGWGQENYALVFDKYYDPRMYNEPFFDRVHNIVFDWLVAGGLVGLIAYLAIFAAALWALWGRGRSGAAGFTIFERSLLTGLMAGYFVHNFFVFDTVTSYMLFATILAYIAYRSSEVRQARYVYAKALLAPASMPYVALVCMALALLGAWEINQRAFAANRDLLQALDSPDVLKKLDYFKESIALRTYGTPEARNQLALEAARIAADASIPTETKRKLYETAVAEMTEQAKISPLNARIPLNLALVQSAYRQFDAAAQSYERAHQLSPKKQIVMFGQAQNEMNRGDMAAALQFAKNAYELDTNFKKAAMGYAAFLIRQGLSLQADQILQPFIAAGGAADAFVLSAYSATNQLSKAIPLWEARLAAQPGDTQAYFTLAAIYYFTGNSQKAIAVIDLAKKATPGVGAQADAVIQQIKNGTAFVQ